MEPKTYYKLNTQMDRGQIIHKSRRLQLTATWLGNHIYNKQPRKPTCSTSDLQEVTLLPPAAIQEAKQ